MTGLVAASQHSFVVMEDGSVYSFGCGDHFRCVFLSTLFAMFELRGTFIQSNVWGKGAGWAMVPQTQSSRQRRSRGWLRLPSRVLQPMAGTPLP